jgi:hypothetical protein
MAPSAVPVEATPEVFPPKACKKLHVSPAKVERTLAAVEHHVVGLAKDAATTLDPNYTIMERPIGIRRPIRVACMGAGYSGLMMAILFSQKMQEKNAELVIYERNEDLGGTWLENRYTISFDTSQRLAADHIVLQISRVQMRYPRSQLRLQLRPKSEVAKLLRYRATDTRLYA